MDEINNTGADNMTFKIQTAIFAAIAVAHVFADGAKLYDVAPIGGAVNLKGACNEEFFNIQAAQVKVAADGSLVSITNGDFFFAARKGLTIA